LQNKLATHVGFGEIRFAANPLQKQQNRRLDYRPDEGKEGTT
jgi:hypothetical protein